MVSPTESDNPTVARVSSVFRHRREDGSRQGHEGLVDVNFVLGGSLQELHAEALGELLAFFVRHLSLVLQVAFIAHQDLHDVRTRVLPHFSHPRLDVLERLAISNIVDEDAAVGTFVVRRGDGFESGESTVPLLAGGIPDLELDAFVVDLELSDSEVDADSRQEALVEYIVGEPAEDVGLACTAVPHNQDLEDVVELLVHAF